MRPYLSHGHFHRRPPPPQPVYPAAKGVSAEALHRHYEEVAGRLEAEGWIVGRRTMSELAKGSERNIANPRRCRVSLTSPIEMAARSPSP